MVKQIRSMVLRTHTKKLEFLSQEQQRPLFDIHDTVKLHELDIQSPRYVIDTLALGPRNAILDKFDSKRTLAAIDALLSNCKKNKVSNEIINDINVATFKYVKSCSNKKSPRNLSLTKKYLKEHNLLAT